MKTFVIEEAGVAANQVVVSLGAATRKDADASKVMVRNRAAAVWGSRMCRIGKEVNQQNQDDARSACYACVMYFGPVRRRLEL